MPNNISSFGTEICSLINSQEVLTKFKKEHIPYERYCMVNGKECQKVRNAENKHYCLADQFTSDYNGADRRRDR